MAKPHYVFVTGKLAEPALRRLLQETAPQAGFDYSVALLPITVVALATTPWIGRHLSVPAGVDRVILPGLCGGDLAVLSPLPVERGPKDLLDLPEYFQVGHDRRPGYGAYDIAILAEINHAPHLPLPELLRQSRAARGAGADVIDLGCTPGETWSGLAEAVRHLRAEGMRVSLDSFNAAEIEAGAAAGVELILSVNRTNRDAARTWGCEVVVVPDVPATLEGLDETVAVLQAAGVPFRIDPIMEPIGFGFAASLGRFLEARRRYPDTDMLMGVGNLTELTEVDSAGVNVMLLGFCQEVGIHSVLTTEVINWCRSCIRELDLARRLVHYACTHHVLPKHLAPDLVMLRDPKLHEHGEPFLAELAARLTDPNFRLFAEGGLLHVLNGQMRLQGTDPSALFQQMQTLTAIDPSHAFYLGYEMAKAVTALTLGKDYVQDQPLRWGFLATPDRAEVGPSAPADRAAKLPPG
jgi:dihydropteroate synthase-like protein